MINWGKPLTCDEYGDVERVEMRPNVRRVYFESGQAWDYCADGTWSRHDFPKRRLRNVFRITGPGRYRRRDGSVTTLDVCGIDSLRCSDRYLYRVGSNGQTFTRPDPLDIIEGPLSDELTGFVVLPDETGHAFRVGNLEQVDKIKCSVIDLSKVPDSAIIRPVRKLSGWVNVYRDEDGDIEMGDGLHETAEGARQACEENSDTPRIACVYIDEFAEGDGL